MLNKPNLFGKRDDTPSPRDARPGSYAPSAAGGNPSAAPTNNPSSPLAQGAASPPASTMTASAANSPDKAADTVSENRLIVGPDVKLKGAEILDCDTLVVEGRVEATMDSRVINIAEKGSFSGKVGIDVAEIHGTFDGELLARSQLIIHATGRVSGKIRYGKILIEEGGEVSGDVRSLSSDADLGLAARASPLATVDLLKSKSLATLS